MSHEPCDCDGWIGCVWYYYVVVQIVVVKKKREKKKVRDETRNKYKLAKFLYTPILRHKIVVRGMSVSARACTRGYFTFNTVNKTGRALNPSIMWQRTNVCAQRSNGRSNDFCACSNILSFKHKTFAVFVFVRCCTCVSASVSAWLDNVKCINGVFLTQFHFIWYIFRMYFCSLFRSGFVRSFVRCKRQGWFSGLWYINASVGQFEWTRWFGAARVVRRTRCTR